MLQLGHRLISLRQRYLRSNHNVACRYREGLLSKEGLGIAMVRVGSTG